MQELSGLELEEFVNTEVDKLARELWPPSIYEVASAQLSAEVVDHGRGLVTSTLVGRSMVVSIGHPPASGEDVVRYERIEVRTKESLRGLLASQLRALVPKIQDALHCSR